MEEEVEERRKDAEKKTIGFTKEKKTYSDESSAIF
jgi:hypothetical protein